MIHAIKRRKRRRMTIGIGLISSQGFVLGADTLIEGETRTYARKLFGVKLVKAPDVSFAIAGAGLEDHVLGLPNLLNRGTKNLKSLGGLTRRIEEIVSEFYEQKVWQMPRLDLADYPEFIIAVREPGLGRMYKIGGAGVLAPVEPEKKFACIGSGQGIAEYIASTLFRPEHGLRVAEVLASYIIKQAKIHGVGVGGETHIARVPIKAAPSLEPVYLKDSDVQIDEQYFESFFTSSADLAYAGLKQSVSTSKMDGLIDDVKNTMRDLRKTVHRGQVWGDMVEVLAGMGIKAVAVGEPAPKTATKK